MIIDHAKMTILTMTYGGAGEYENERIEIPNHSKTTP